jgi:subtilisin-like proprotein convertase family protein
MRFSFSRPPVLLLAVFLMIAASGSAGAVDTDLPGDSGRATPVRVELSDSGRQLQQLRAMKLDVDGVFDGWARVYLSPAEMKKLRHLGYRLTPLPDEGLLGLARLQEEGLALGATARDVPAQYHDYVTLTQDLQTIAADHPDLTELFSAGQSVQGRELWIMKITANPDIEEAEPELLYIAAMHGDEVVGKEMCVNLINLLTDDYGQDPRITQLVDSAEIWIMPSMNPDGTASGTRYNAAGVDLNRDFPDWFSDPVNTPDGREAETGHVMAWTESHSPVLSANFHGGALLINYPFDNNETGSSVFSPTPDPDQDTFYSVSLTYAENNLPMYNGSFPNGVTNGAEWYAIDGGMQDWNYCWYGNFEVTAEIGTKWPPASQLPTFWNDNRESMLSYFERGLEGVGGVVSDADSGTPVAATVFIDDNPFPSYTDPDVGDYHRVVLPGSYTLSVSALGYQTQIVPVVVPAGLAAQYDVTIHALQTDLEEESHRVDYVPAGDGMIDPGEEVRLGVTLQNLGLAATGISGKLVPAGWFSDVVVEQATYPDLGTGQSAECVAPCFRIGADAGVPAGYKLGFAVDWTADQGSGVSEPFFVGVGEPSCQIVDATDVPQSILDDQTITSTIQITAGGEIAEVRIPVSITHTYIGDLTVELIAPSGTEVMLHNRSGGSTNDIVGTYGDDLTPAEPLTVLDGESAVGAWKLRITDHAGGDTGTLNRWSVDVCGDDPLTATPEMRLRDVDVVAGSVLLRWWPYPGLDSYRVYRSTNPVSALAFSDVTTEDGDDTDTEFLDTAVQPITYYLVTGVGSLGEGPLGHFGQ